MANEVTGTTVNDVIYSAVIEAVLLSALSERANAIMLARESSLIGKPSNALDIPVMDSYWGSPADDGVGVDTEFNATEATELSNTGVTTSKVTVTAAEYGVAHELTDNVSEDSVDGIDLLGTLEGTMMGVLALAMEDDMLAQFANLSSSVGTSGSDLTVAQLLAAQTGIRVRGGIAPDGLAYVLDNQQGDDVEAALIATNAAQAVYAQAADRLLAYSPSANNGMDNREIMRFRGYPVIVSGLTDTANAAADVVGACFIPSSARNDEHATYAQVWKRLPRFETERHAKKRTTDLVATARWGVAELRDGTGTKIVTDA